MNWRKRQRRVKDSLDNRGCVVSILRAVYSAEIAAWWRYFSSADFLEGVCAEVTRLAFRNIAWDELEDHAVHTSRRLAELGACVPYSSLDMLGENPIPEYIKCFDTLNALVAAIVTEQRTILYYKGILADPCIAQDDDVSTRNMIEHFVADEEQHVLQLSNILDELIKTTRSPNAEYTEPFTVYVGESTYAHIGFLNCRWKVAGIVREGNLTMFEDPASDPILSEHLNNLGGLEGQVSVTASDLSEVATLGTEPYNQVKYEDVVVTALPQQVVVEGPAAPAQVMIDPDIDKMMDSIRKVSKKVDISTFKAIMDSLEEREVNGKKIRVQKFENAEEANKFLEKNKGFVPVDQDETGEVYVALESQTDDQG